MGTTVIVDASGWLESVCVALRRLAGAHLRRRSTPLCCAFAEYGVSDRIRSDNGLLFAGIGLNGLSRLAVWWMRCGIVPERIVPGRPEQNGSTNSFMHFESGQGVLAGHLRAQQRARSLCHEYNTERPHEALDYQVPADRYQPSPRRLPSVLPPVAYQGHLEIRRVSDSGEMLARENDVSQRDARRGKRRLRRSR